MPFALARHLLLLLTTIYIDFQIPIKARGSGRGQLEITYLDEELRYATY